MDVSENEHRKIATLVGQTMFFTMGFWCFPQKKVPQSHIAVGQNWAT